MFDIREIFDPSYAAATMPGDGARVRWTPPGIYRLVRDFYRQRIAWVVLAISALVLVYGGGALMFWYHSIYLGEGGPAISPTLHWFVDSTAGFIALTPALAVILPIATYQARQHLAYFAIVGGTLFALATVPGPVMHDNFIGRGTWFADQLTRLWGDGRALPPAHHIEAPVAMSLQLAFALPVYIILMWLTLICIRGLIRLARINSPGGSPRDTRAS